jgi:hypothetical protein
MTNQSIKAAKALTNKIDNITPSGYAGLIDRIITVNDPYKIPYIKRPLFVWQPVTGSVAINAVPNKKLPITK